MSVKKIESGEWTADLRPNGSTGKRYRKTFKTKAEALRWEAWIKTNKTQRQEWEPARKDSRRLSALIEIWFEAHGKTLSSGQDIRANLLKATREMENPLANEFSAAMFAKWRAGRIEAGTKRSTTNNIKILFGGVFNELERLGEWKGENPLKRMKRLKEEDPETRYLETAEIAELLTALKSRKSSAYHIALICLATGARWSEAESLSAEQITPTHITFWNTKSRKNRTVPISRELFDAIPKREGRLFGRSIDVFRDVAGKLSFQFPDGQLTHILRHTFASHFMTAGGNLKALQELLGHSSITHTMRYAHLSPSLLDTARSLNPLAQMDIFRTKAPEQASRQEKIRTKTIR